MKLCPFRNLCSSSANQLRSQGKKCRLVGQIFSCSFRFVSTPPASTPAVLSRTPGRLCTMGIRWEESLYIFVSYFIFREHRLPKTLHSYPHIPASTLIHISIHTPASTLIHIDIHTPATTHCHQSPRRKNIHSNITKPFHLRHDAYHS